MNSSLIPLWTVVMGDASSTLLMQVSVGGKWVFVGALGLVLIWLIVMPRRLVSQEGTRPRWWRNVRIWAIVICVVQIWIYWRFG